MFLLHYNGYPIDVDQRGQFSTQTEEGELLKAVQLSTLQAQIDRVETHRRTKSHAAATPVDLMVLYSPKGVWGYVLVEAKILGIQAGRTYSRAARALVNGKRVAIEGHSAYVLHPDDGRIPVIHAHIARLSALDREQKAVEAEFSALRAALTALQIPAVQEAEDARAVEPAWLDTLRQIPPAVLVLGEEGE